MISLPGELVLTTRTGKYGNFNVAKLFTSIGQFTVKDRSLDQYDAGKYQGTFVIKQIKSSSFAYDNRVVIECCAYIEEMELSNSSKLNEFEIGQTNVTEDPVLLDEKDLNIENIEQQKQHDADLFGILWPLKNKVKLDSTEDRLKIRQQKERLISLGYRFDFKEQVWNLISENSNNFSEQF